ncbi:MAG: transcription elongation factor GreA [Myxococcales bacterium]|nr:transcription elongation factor GreA [Myxococcales bacterium]
MAERIPMTPEGYAKLQNELHQLKTVEKHKNIRDIEEARAHGDLSENAEYQYAKERQGQIAGLINHLEDQIARAEVIDPRNIKSDRVVFGATVTLLDIDEDKEVTFSIVGPPEADPKINRISILSPMAKAMIGKRVEDEVEVPTAQGERFYEVISIKFG